jgi:transcriptional regulator with XRE-family HTH domain
MTNQEEREIYQAESQKLKELYEIKKNFEKSKGLEFTQRNIAKIGGWTQPNVSAYLRGVVVLKEDAAEVFAEALGVDVEAFSPRLAAAITRRNLLAKSPQSFKRSSISYVPVLTATDMNNIRSKLKDDNFTMPTSKSVLPINQPVSHKCFAIELGDTSFASKIEKGACIIFNPELEPQATDIVYVGNKHKDDDYHVRIYNIIKFNPDGTHQYELTAPNPAFPTLDDNYEVLGVAQFSMEIQSLR